MSSYSEQIAAVAPVRRAKTALDTQVRALSSAAVEEWAGTKAPSLASGFESISSIVRNSYHTGAALARVHITEQANIPGWEAPAEKRTPPYLKSLLADVRRNMRTYLTGTKDDKALRRLRNRVAHSAGVASQRGYTDAMVRAAADLEKVGVHVRKIWTANFINHVPCPECQRLHGTEAKISEQFVKGATRVYRDLLGPPAHPHCHCVLVLLIVGPDNANEEVDLEAPPTPPAREMSSDDVKKMPRNIWVALLLALARLVKFLLGR